MVPEIFGIFPKTVFSDISDTAGKPATIQLTNLDLSWFNAENRLLIALTPWAPIKTQKKQFKKKRCFNVINHGQANNNRFNLRTYDSLALKFYGWAYFMMPNNMERVR